MRPDDNATVYTGAGTVYTMGETIYQPPEDDSQSASTHQASEWGNNLETADQVQFDLLGMGQGSLRTLAPSPKGSLVPL